MRSLKLTTLWQTNNLAGDKTRFTQRTGKTLAHFFKDRSQVPTDLSLDKGYPFLRRCFFIWRGNKRLVLCVNLGV